ncbi:major histocompatibility complex class I UMA isoform 2 precursor [Danio rerio]|uniref:Major histocompatibility complex class I UMA isoform 2 precursor n=1 Tax=Danio rerio TaxID=7955 RepID=A0AB13A8A8_DANRE|nr:major histocompatibility complex class I UMA isoform 2 precursor [Danio rerio]|eukprot:XP_005161941.1 major histocompatibility complex class I-related gene protein isoform X2 [Danio rerio]
MSIMKFIIFFFNLPFVYSELHTFVVTYTAMGNQTFFAAATLDGQQIGHYDKNTKTLVPKQDWNEQIKSKTPWKVDTLIETVQRTYNNNMHDLIEQFPQSNGAHTYQGRHGCSWEDKTNYHDEFHDYAYDGDDFITLDVKKIKYRASVSKAKYIVKKWNNDREQNKTLKEYYKLGCIYWLIEFLVFTKNAFGGTAPKMFLLQKSPNSDVKCHVTGFYSNNIVILWMKNGQEVSNSALLKSGEILPNEDGTFQRTVTLRVSLQYWRKEQYTCVVRYMEKTIRRNLTEEEIKSNYSEMSITAYSSTSILVPIIVVVLVVSLILWWMSCHQNCRLGQCFHLENAN